MTTTRQIKTMFVNSGNTSLTTPNGTQAETPEFIYKSQTLIHWHIRDANKNDVDLSGATFEFVIAEDYNTTPLVTVANSSFVLADWSSSDISTGHICCRVDLNQAAIGTLLDLVEYDNAYCSLWATLGGIDYLLVAFTCSLKNLIH